MQPKPKKSEAQIQAAITKHLKAAGWTVIKLIQTSCNGIPDLLAIRSGRYLWIEAKNATGKVAPLQEYRHTELRRQGCEVIVARSTEDVKEYLKQNP